MLMDPRDIEQLEKVDKNTNIIQLPSSYAYRPIVIQGCERDSWRDRENV